VKFNVCKMNFRFRARFGHTGYELENTTDYISSDRLFSAIFIEWKEIYGLEDATKTLIDNEFKVSNAFPYVSDTLYFPRPRLNITREDLSNDFYDNNRKKIKALTYLTKTSLENLIAGKRLGKEAVETEIKAYSKLKKSITTDLPQKVAIKISEDNKLFRVKEMYFNKDSGLYFIYEIKSEFTEKFKKVLKSLGITGIGSDRSTGAGCFEIDFSQITVNNEFEAKRYYTLSEVIPTVEEIEKIKEQIGQTGYGLVKKGGRVHEKGTFKVPGYAFSAGSVFPININGKIDTFENNIYTHKVYRYGKTINLAIKGGI